MATQTVEVVMQVTFTVDVDAADKQSAIEEVWDTWYGWDTQTAFLEKLTGLVRSCAGLDLITVDGTDERGDADAEGD